MLCAYGEAKHTTFIVCGMTRPGLASTINRIRGEHASHPLTVEYYCNKYCYYPVKLVSGSSYPIRACALFSEPLFYV